MYVEIPIREVGRQVLVVALVQSLELRRWTWPRRTDFSVGSYEAAHALRAVPLTLGKLGRVRVPTWVLLARQSGPSGAREGVLSDVPLQVRSGRYVARFAMHSIIILFFCSC